MYDVLYDDGDREEMSRGEVEALLLVYDADGSGGIELQEFHLLWEQLDLGTLLAAAGVTIPQPAALSASAGASEERRRVHHSRSSTVSPLRLVSSNHSSANGGLRYPTFIATATSSWE